MACYWNSLLLGINLPIPFKDYISINSFMTVANSHTWTVLLILSILCIDERLIAHWEPAAVCRALSWFRQIYLSPDMKRSSQLVGEWSGGQKIKQTNWPMKQSQTVKAPWHKTNGVSWQRIMRVWNLISCQPQGSLTKLTWSGEKTGHDVCQN